MSPVGQPSYSPCPPKNPTPFPSGGHTRGQRRHQCPLLRPHTPQPHLKLIPTRHKPNFGLVQFWNPRERPFLSFGTPARPGLECRGKEGNAGCLGCRTEPHAPHGQRTPARGLNGGGGGWLRLKGRENGGKKPPYSCNQATGSFFSFWEAGPRWWSGDLGEDTAALNVVEQLAWRVAAAIWVGIEV